jgi:hypothetical protein
LKSAHHTAFGPVACASGWVRGGTWRRRRRGTTKPAAVSNSPTVLGAGQTCSGWVEHR